MSSQKYCTLLLILTTVSIMINSSTTIQAQEDRYARFRPSIKVFQDYDRKNAWPENPVLFIGSSSIRGYNTREYFPELAVINRSFGGCHISDINYFVNETVLKYDPSLIVFYCGDNDIASGKSPQRVLADYETFITNIREKPGQPIPVIYLAIKPSSRRWHYYKEMDKANTLIKSFTNQSDHLYYLDTASILLNEENRPDDGFFRDDKLHLNEKGYQVWTKKLQPLIHSILQPDE